MAEKTKVVVELFPEELQALEELGSAMNSRARGETIRRALKITARVWSAEVVTVDGQELLRA